MRRTIGSKSASGAIWIPHVMPFTMLSSSMMRNEMHAPYKHSDEDDDE